MKNRPHRTLPAVAAVIVCSIPQYGQAIAADVPRQTGARLIQSYADRLKPELNDSNDDAETSTRDRASIGDQKSAVCNRSNDRASTSTPHRSNQEPAACNRSNDRASTSTPHRSDQEPAACNRSNDRASTSTPHRSNQEPAVSNSGHDHTITSRRDRPLIGDQERPSLAFREQDITKDEIEVSAQGRLSEELKIPIHNWRLLDQAPRAVLVALHGATLHGGTFDTFAREMAKRGYVVFAPDLRGFGHWHIENGAHVPNGKIAFYKDRADLVTLLRRLRERYEGLPVYCIGESLGSNLALWLASVHPHLVDGVIVSSPCVKRRNVLCPTLVADFLKAPFNPHRQIPLAPYARRYLSEDRNIIESYLSDPAIRKTMSVYESLQSLHVNRSSLRFLEYIPPWLPILVIQGTHDRMYDAKAIKPLLDRIPSSDEQVRLLPKRGHIHLETPHIKPDVIATIDDWLRRRLSPAHSQALTRSATR